MVMLVFRGIVMICGRVEDKIIGMKDVTELRGHDVGCSFIWILESLRIMAIVLILERMTPEANSSKNEG